MPPAGPSAALPRSWRRRTHRSDARASESGITNASSDSRAWPYVGKSSDKALDESFQWARRGSSGITDASALTTLRYEPEIARRKRQARSVHSSVYVQSIAQFRSAAHVNPRAPPPCPPRVRPNASIPDQFAPSSRRFASPSGRRSARLTADRPAINSHAPAINSHAPRPIARSRRGANPRCMLPRCMLPRCMLPRCMLPRCMLPRCMLPRCMLPRRMLPRRPVCPASIVGLTPHGFDP